MPTAAKPRAGTTTTKPATTKPEPVDRTAEFFAALAARGHEPLLARATGTIRFDLVDGDQTEHWYITVKKGDVKVSHKNARANATAQSPKALFDLIACGRENAMAALLRGAFMPQGDLALLLSFQRVFPGPPNQMDSPKAGYAKRMR